MKTVLVTGARAPVALHWARVLAQAGHRVLLADSHRFPMSRSTRFKAAYVRLPPPRGAMADYVRAIIDIVRRERVEFVLPTCEEIFYLAAARDLHGAAIPLLAPDFAVLKRVHDKFSFATMALGFGADPPKTALIVAPQDLAHYRDSSRDLVFKPVWSRFADRALIRPDWKTLARTVPTIVDPWVAQDYLPGGELCAWALARAGKVLALQAYRPLYRAGKGASLAFEAIESPAISGFVAALVESVAWTGQISFDFRHDAEGRLRAIECNPRATSGLHFYGPDDGLAEALVSGSATTASRKGRMTLPLAMVAYALPTALRNGTVKRWWSDLCAMDDISCWPGDRAMLPAQGLALAEIALVALRQRIGLKAATTADIEWNGEELGPQRDTPFRP